MKPFDLFIQHPASVGEGYGQHLRAALGFSGQMLVGGLACFVHAVFPFLFVKTGSDVIRGLHDRMLVNRHAASAPDRLAEPVGADHRRPA